MYTNKCGRGNKQDVSVYHIFKQQDFYKKITCVGMHRLLFLPIFRWWVQNFHVLVRPKTPLNKIPYDLAYLRSR